MDYAFFSCGLASMLLSVVVITLRRFRNGLLPWSWLAAYGCLQVAYHWLELIAFILGYAHFSPIVANILAVASYAALAEFGIQGAQPKGKSNARKQWANHSLLLLLAICGLCGWPQFASASKHILALVAAIWSAKALYRLASAAIIQERGFLLRASLTLFFAVIIADVVEVFSFNLAASSSSSALSGNAVSLILHACAALLCLAVSTSLWGYTQFRSVNERCYDCQLRVRSGVTEACAIVFIVACGWFVAYAVSNQVDSRQREELLLRASSAAPIIDQDKVASFAGSPTDEAKDEFSDVSVQLRAIRNCNPDYKGVYLMGLRSGKIVFLADSELPSSENYSMPGEVYDEASPQLAASLRTGKAFTEGPMGDRWGCWVSALVPIKSHDGQKVIALLGIDLLAQDWWAKIVRYRAYPMLVVLLLVSSAAVVMFLQRNRDKFSAQVASSEHHYRVLLEGCPSAVAIFDRHGRFINANSAGIRGMGRSAAELMGLQFKNLWPEESLDLAHECFDEVINGRNAEFEAEMIKPDGQRLIWDVALIPITNAHGHVCQFSLIASDCTELRQSERELRKAHSQIELVLASMTSMLISLDDNGVVMHWNPAAESAFGISESVTKGKSLAEIELDWDFEMIASGIEECRKYRERVRLDRIKFKRMDGSDGLLGIVVSPMKSTDNALPGILMTCADITERLRMESQLDQGRKMEAIGQLAAGIAHEINTPTQYVLDNLRFLNESFGDIHVLLDEYNVLFGATASGAVDSDLVARVEKAIDDADVDYLLEEIPKAVEQSREGMERVAKIVRAMKEFSHPGVEEKKPADINRIVENAITVARNEWKYVAEVEMDFADNLEPISAVAGLLSQSILNIVVNAAHAIGEAIGEQSSCKGQIKVQTRPSSDGVEIRISDTGPGIPENVLNRIFDPFFTTKDVGKGTGQGLSIAYSVVVDRHGGTINVETEIGKGTTFVIYLPHGDSNQSDIADAA